jgi:hypothetical protein
MQLKVRYAIMFWTFFQIDDTIVENRFVAFLKSNAMKKVVTQ